MDLSRRDAFRPCSRDSLGDKGQFCFINQIKLQLKYSRSPLSPFLGYTSLSDILLLQNFSPTTTDRCYTVLTHNSKPSNLPLV